MLRHIKAEWILYHTSGSEVYHAALAVYHIYRQVNITLKHRKDDHNAFLLSIGVRAYPLYISCKS